MSVSLVTREAGITVSQLFQSRKAHTEGSLVASNTRWCSNGFEVGCDNGERVRVAIPLEIGPVIPL